MAQKNKIRFDLYFRLRYLVDVIYDIETNQKSTEKQLKPIYHEAEFWFEKNYAYYHFFLLLFFNKNKLSARP